MSIELDPLLVYGDIRTPRGCTCDGGPCEGECGYRPDEWDAWEQGFGVPAFFAALFRLHDPDRAPVLTIILEGARVIARDGPDEREGTLIPITPLDIRAAPKP